VLVGILDELRRVDDELLTEAPPISPADASGLLITPRRE
jgi:hypothetical protein